MNPLLTVVVLFSVIYILSIAAAAQSDGESLFTVRMKGYGEGIGLTARRLAIEDAQHQVLLDVLRSMINSEDMSPFRGMLRQASKYIKRYDVLRSDVIGETTEVEIDAFVFEKPLRNDVAAAMLPRLPRKPSVLIIIAEYIGKESVSGGPTFDVAENVLRERMKEFEFPITGINNLITHHDPMNLVSIINGDVNAGAAFARANTEDIVITGSVVVMHEPVLADSNMLSNRAKATLRVFSGHDGKMTDVITSQAVVQSVDPQEGGKQAVQDACAKLTADVVVSIVLTMLSLEDESRVLIELENPINPETVSQVSRFIESIPGVFGVETLFFSETLARFAVEYYGDMADFSDRLNSMIVNSRKIEIKRCVKREITLIFQ